MIIFGTTGITRTPGRGVYYCPGCGPDAPYAHKKVQRFFTLYFIPLIPLDVVGEYINCERCGGEFNMEALNFDPSQQAMQLEEIFNLATRQTLIATILCNGGVDENQITALHGQYNQLTNSTVPDDQLRQEVAALHADGIKVDELLQSIAHAVNDSGKEALVKSVYQVALADGAFDAQEQEFLAKVGRAVGMSEAHMMGVLAEATGVQAPQLPQAPPPQLPPGQGLA